MSTSYPKVHVVGSGAYYSYRPITRYLEKADRNYIREASSRPNEFSKYLSASTSRGSGYVGRDRSLDREGRDFFRGSSLPPLDSGRETKSGASKREETIFKKTSVNDPFFQSENTDSLFKRRGRNEERNETSSYSRGRNEALNESSSYSRRSEKAAAKSVTSDETFDYDKKALFSSGDDVLTRLRRKHPFRLPVENEVVPPHESSIWPENRPHFDLVSSYDVMVDYLGIRDKSKK